MLFGTHYYIMIFMYAFILFMTLSAKAQAPNHFVLRQKNIKFDKKEKQNKIYITIVAFRHASLFT